MKLTYLPEWQLINQSKQAFAIQEDENSISLVSPINDYAMGILSQVFFTIKNDEVTDTSVENNGYIFNNRYNFIVVVPHVMKQCVTQFNKIGV